MALGESFVEELIEPPEMARLKAHHKLGVSGGGDIHKDLVFPHDLSTHMMLLSIHQFEHNLSGREEKSFMRSIALPIPTNLVESQGVQYNEIELGAIGGELSDLIATLDHERMEGHLSAFFGSTFKLGENLTSKTGRAKVMTQLQDPQNTAVNAATMGLRKAGNPIGFGLNRFFGSAPNPHVTTMFRGVSLRNHNFTWLLVPSSVSESNTIRTMLAQLKQSMLPERTTQNMTLSFPDQFHISIVGTNGADFFYKFKPAVLRSLSINYAPNGTPGYYAGTGAPAAIQISLDFLETVIHTREDYNAGDDFLGDRIKGDDYTFTTAEDQG